MPLNFPCDLSVFQINFSFHTCKTRYVHLLSPDNIEISPNRTCTNVLIQWDFIDTARNSFMGNRCTFEVFLNVADDHYFRCTPARLDSTSNKYLPTEHVHHQFLWTWNQKHTQKWQPSLTVCTIIYYLALNPSDTRISYFCINYIYNYYSPRRLL